MSWLLNQIEDEFTLAETLLRMHYEIDVPKFYNVVRLQPDKARFTLQNVYKKYKVSFMDKSIDLYVNWQLDKDIISVFQPNGNEQLVLDPKYRYSKLNLPSLGGRVQYQLFSVIFNAVEFWYKNHACVDKHAFHRLDEFKYRMLLCLDVELTEAGFFKKSDHVDLRTPFDSDIWDYDDDGCLGDGILETVRDYASHVYQHMPTVDLSLVAECKTYKQLVALMLSHAHKKYYKGSVALSNAARKLCE